MEDLLWGDQVLLHEAWLPWDFDIVVTVVKKIPEDPDGPHFPISFISLQDSIALELEMIGRFEDFAVRLCSCDACGPLEEGVFSYSLSS